MTIATGEQALAADVAPFIAAKAIKACDTLRNSNDTERGPFWEITEYTKRKETKLNANLVACRIKFDTYNNIDDNTTYAKIYKNGTPIGVEHTNNQNGSWLTFSEDFTNFSQNDLIQIYLYQTGIENRNHSVKNMRFYYSRFITQFSDDVLSTSLETTTDVAISMTNQDP